MNIQDKGSNNEIKTESVLGSVNIEMAGDGNKIHIGPNVRVQSAEIIFRGNGSSILIEDNCRFGNLRVIIQDSAKIIIGRNSTIEQTYLLARDGRMITLGEDCMISFQTDFRTSDAHGIYDKDSRQLLNFPGDIVIGNHVWIGQGCWISKNTIINSGAVIGAKTMVQNDVIPENSIYAGTPGRVIRNGVVWTRNIILDGLPLNN